MDYASGGSLFDYVKPRKRLKESVGRWFFQQLVFAVDYCHRKVRASVGFYLLEGRQGGGGGRGILKTTKALQCELRLKPTHQHIEHITPQLTGRGEPGHQAGQPAAAAGAGAGAAPAQSVRLWVSGS